MDRQFELNGLLPKEDWEAYSRSLPVMARGGEGYTEQYLGRESLATHPRVWKVRLIQGVVVGSILLTPFLTEFLKDLSWPAALTLGVLVGLEAHYGGKFTTKILDRVNTTKRILNPEV